MDAIGTVHVESLSFWTPTLPGWPAARAAFRGEGSLADPPARRPAPEMLAPAERRRVPDTVALALEVAASAVRDAGLDAAGLACVFTSAHGDLTVNDYMCSTLASQPTAISPTKFHNSVHNAAAGYWTIGTGCTAPSTALAAFEHSFAAGLLEAVMQCLADDRPVLLVASDVQSVGALASVTRSDGLLATGLVIAPAAGERSIATLTVTRADGGSNRAPLRSPAARSLAGNAMADALPFYEWLARDAAAPLDLPLSSALALRLTPRPQVRR